MNRRLEGAPNLYRVSGEGVEVTYSTSSFAGPPQFSFKNADHDVQASGDEIRRAETEVGSLVTVTLEIIPDFRRVTATLILPSINLDGPTAFETYVLLTTHADSLIGPSGVKGPLDTYRAFAVKGEAQIVEF